MDGVTFLKNEHNNHRLMQIDLDALPKNADALEDLYDMIAVQLRREEESVPWNVAKEELKKYGK
jgi:hypothetical protein